MKKTLTAIALIGLLAGSVAAQEGDTSCGSCSSCQAGNAVYTDDIRDIWKDVDISQTAWDKIPEPPKAAPKKKAKKPAGKKPTQQKASAKKTVAKPANSWSTLDQFLVASQIRAKNSGREWSKEKAIKAFQRVDSDHDGIASPEERAVGQKKAKQKK
ncbi:MAG: hypothetical protein K9M45_02370 [Kiritimatiellales bacterium]|nr:hypothetical protein [Kiritimatiellales bacterium]